MRSAVTLSGNLVQQLVGNGLNARPHLANHARRERFADQRPQPPVVCAILIEQMVVYQAKNGVLGQLGQPLRGHNGAEVAGEAFVIAQNHLRFVIAGDKPDQRLAIQARLLPERMVLPHLGKGFVAVGFEGRAV
jgi:hypothetical protein